MGSEVCRSGWVIGWVVIPGPFMCPMRPVSAIGAVKPVFRMCPQEPHYGHVQNSLGTAPPAAFGRFGHFAEEDNRMARSTDRHVENPDVADSPLVVKTLALLGCPDWLGTWRQLTTLTIGITPEDSRLSGVKRALERCDMAFLAGSWPAFEQAAAEVRLQIESS